MSAATTERASGEAQWSLILCEGAKREVVVP